MLGICQPDACCGSRLASPISAQLTSGRSCPSISGSGTPVTCNFINKQQFPYLGLGAHIYIYTHIYICTIGFESLESISFPVGMPSKTLFGFHP